MNTRNLVNSLIACSLSLTFGTDTALATDTQGIPEHVVVETEDHPPAIETLRKIYSNFKFEGRMPEEWRLDNPSEKLLREFYFWARESGNLEPGELYPFEKEDVAASNGLSNLGLGENRGKSANGYYHSQACNEEQEKCLGAKAAEYAICFAVAAGTDGIGYGIATAAGFGCDWLGGELGDSACGKVEEKCVKIPQVHSSTTKTLSVIGAQNPEDYREVTTLCPGHNKVMGVYSSWEKMGSFFYTTRLRLTCSDGTNLNFGENAGTFPTNDTGWAGTKCGKGRLLQGIGFNYNSNGITGVKTRCDSVAYSDADAEDIVGPVYGEEGSDTIVYRKCADHLFVVGARVFMDHTGVSTTNRRIRAVELLCKRTYPGPAH
jgi:hypothetical protein